MIPEHDLIFNPAEYPIALGIDPGRLTRDSTWVGHIPFAFALVEMCRPQTIVELGTASGDSYCAFCQAVKQLDLPTRCTAIDTWQGDPQHGVIGPEVLDGLRRAHDPHYASFSTLVQATFDEALPSFADGSIDLLHVDGLHTYEAVRHDYETWLPKVNPRTGVILFHDTRVPRPGYDVQRLWQEITPARDSFEFHHAFGLGVLVVGDDPPARLVRFIRAANSNPEVARGYFAELGASVERLRSFRYALMITHRLINRIEEQAGLGGSTGVDGLRQLTSQHDVNADPRGALRYLSALVQDLIVAHQDGKTRSTGRN